MQRLLDIRARLRANDAKLIRASAAGVDDDVTSHPDVVPIPADVYSR